jgi:GT2 family glycosyltransferase
VYDFYMDNEKLLVLMSTHNRQVDLTSSLTALRDSLPSQNFVVSLSNSGDHIEPPKAPGFEIKVSKVSPSSFWAAAMYSASSLFAGADKFTHVLWLNDDVTLFPNSVADLLTLIRSSDADIVVGQTSSEDGQISYGGFVRNSALKPLHFERIVAGDEPLNVDTFNGNIVLLGSKALSSIGPFLPGYKHYLADIAYGLEATSKGLKILVAPGFSGACQPNVAVNPSLDKRVTRIKRIQMLNQSQGIPFRQQWQFSLRYGGALGIFYFVATYVRFMLTLLIHEKTSPDDN